MHALPRHPGQPRHALLAGLIALVIGLLIIAAAAPDLGALDLRPGDNSGASTQVERPLPASPEATSAAKPTWVTNPLASPLGALAGRQ